MLYPVVGTVYFAPCLPHRALHIYWIRTPNLRRGGIPHVRRPVFSPPEVTHAEAMNTCITRRSFAAPGVSEFRLPSVLLSAR
jgi:hypothetical protein